jgi:hypothetical protein
MALGDLEVKGTLKVVGTTEMAGFAKDATLITNLNADQMDSADLDIDVTLTANSDGKIPSQKAVKAYTDARKAECVALTGDQTVAGIKTLSSIPVLPASDPTTDNQAVRKAYVDGSTVVHRTGNETIAGIKTFSSQSVMSKGNKVNGSVYGDSQTQNTVFDAISPFVPTIADTIFVSGWLSSSSVAVYDIAYATRASSNTIIFYGRDYTGATSASITITDGSATAAKGCLAW